MINNLSKRSRKRVHGILPVLIEVLEKGISESPYDFGIPNNGGSRTPLAQRKLYARGRTTEELLAKFITNLEGQPDRTKITWTLNSKHMVKEDGYGHAFDIFAYVDGKASWDLKYLEPIARHLQSVAKELGVELIWGQDVWGKDGAHFQIGGY